MLFSPKYSVSTSVFCFSHNSSLSHNALVAPQCSLHHESYVQFPSFSQFSVLSHNMSLLQACLSCNSLSYNIALSNNSYLLQCSNLSYNSLFFPMVCFLPQFSGLSHHSPFCPIILFFLTMPPPMMYFLTISWFSNNSLFPLLFFSPTMLYASCNPCLSHLSLSLLQFCFFMNPVSFIMLCFPIILCSFPGFLCTSFSSLVFLISAPQFSMSPTIPYLSHNTLHFPMILLFLAQCPSLTILFFFTIFFVSQCLPSSTILCFILSFSCF